MNFKELVSRVQIRPVQILYVVVGALLSGVAINVFYTPIALTMGGVSGVVSIIYQLTGRGGFLTFGQMVAILNIPLLILGWWKIGIRFVWRSIVGTFVYSWAIDFSQPFMHDWFEKYINVRLGNGNLPDLLIFCVFGGIIYGISMGFVFRGGFTTGGTDILGVILHRRFPNISIGTMLLFLDVTVVLSTLFFYRSEGSSSLILAMYSFVAMWFSSRFTDITIEGIDFSRATFIISDRHEEIAAEIMDDLERGVTKLEAVGMYSGERKGVLYCVLLSRQIPRLKQLVHRIDPKAFVVVMEAREVQGEGWEGNPADFLKF